MQARASAAWRIVRKNKAIYLLLLPAALYYLIFKYLPMYGLLIAFKDVSPLGGFEALFFGGKWVGLKYFRRFVDSYYFWQIFGNTLIISAYNLLFVFPAPILLALILNEVESRRFKKLTQTLSYLPHFLSVVVVTSLVYALLSVDGGALNALLKSLGQEPRFFLGEPRYFRTILITMNLWRSVGWGSIVYLAALAGVDPSLYDSARVDGAGKLQQMVYITLPGISQVIVIMLILKIGHVLDAGFDEILLLYSPQVYSVADIIDTFVYREGLQQLQYSYTTAVSMFKAVVSLVLVLGTNRLAKRLGHQGIW